MKLEPRRSAVPAVLTDQQERYAVHYATYGDPVDAYRHAYNPTTTRRASLQQLAYRVLHNPKVSARIAALRNANAADEVATRERLIVDLERMVEADVREIVQWRTAPCVHCWPPSDDGLALAVEIDYLAALASADAGEAKPRAFASTPDPSRPRLSCPSCAGSGRTAVTMTDTDLLSEPVRRLIKSVELDGGSLKRLHLHDQAQLRIELHRLRGMHVDRSVNLNVNANVPAFKDMSNDQALDFLESLKPAT